MKKLILLVITLLLIGTVFAHHSPIIEADKMYYHKKGLVISEKKPVEEINNTNKTKLLEKKPVAVRETNEINKTKVKPKEIPDKKSLEKSKTIKKKPRPIRERAKDWWSKFKGWFRR